MAGVFRERLIFVVLCVHYAVFDTPRRVCVVDGHMICLCVVWLVVSVVDSGRETPGPIPNPEAKPARADGTALGRVWESKLPPTQQLQNMIKQPACHTRGRRAAFS